jgi:hypothetical protein
MTNKVFVTEVYAHPVEEDDPVGGVVGVASVVAGIIFDPLFLLGTLVGSESETTTRYDQREQEVDLDTIKSIDDIDAQSYASFRKAGAHTTLWDTKMRPMHVVQPKSLLEKFKQGS